MMKNIRTALVASALCLLVAGCIVTRFAGYAADPDISPSWGVKLFKGLKGEARIYRDKWGVAHIASDDESALFFAVGYAQAQDRLFEMYLMRHVMEGRVSEIVGNMNLSIMPRAGSSSTVDLDKAQRIFGFKYLGEAGEELVRTHRPDVYRMFSSFSDGVNAAIDEMVANNTLPLEFRMLKFTPDHWRVADCISVHRYFGWGIGANLDTELMRYALFGKFGRKNGMAFLPMYRKPLDIVPTIIPREMRDFRPLKPVVPPETAAAPGADSRFMASLLGSLLEINYAFTNGDASNSWVVGPGKSKSGKPILCNDPHLNHMLPSIFWTVHIQGAGFDCYGVTFPGLPLIAIGHNRHLAWGQTTAHTDIQDVFIERVHPKNPNLYLYRGKWEKFTTRREIIKVRKGINGPQGPPVEFDVKLSRHGPIINSISHVPSDAPPMAVRWTGYDFNSDTDLTRAVITSSSVPELAARTADMQMPGLYSDVDAALGLMRAKNMDDFKAAMKNYCLPNQNFIFADDSGNFGYIAAGRIPIRPNHLGIAPVDGSSGRYDWKEFVPFEQLPQVYNPARGYIATANNEIAPPEDYPYIITDRYVPGYRAARIEEMLKEKDKLDATDMERIQADVLMVQARAMAPMFLKLMEGYEGLTEKQREILKDFAAWDYRATVDSTACMVYHEWYRQIVHMMLEDDLGDLFDQYIHVHYTRWYLDYMILNGSPFFDDVRTPQREYRRDIVRAAFVKAVEHLEKTMGRDPKKWKWGAAHTITLGHPFAVGPLKRFLNFGPLPQPGSEGTVMNASFSGIGDDGWKTGVGPTARRIVDMADVPGSLFVTDGGESGQWRSPHYTDISRMWYNGEYFNAIMNIGEVAKEGRGLIVLKPLH